MNPFFLTIATVCFNVGYYGWEGPGDAHKHLLHKQVCIEAVVAKSTMPVVAKGGQTVYQVVDPDHAYREQSSHRYQEHKHQWYWNKEWKDWSCPICGKRREKISKVKESFEWED